MNSKNRQGNPTICGIFLFFIAYDIYLQAKKGGEHCPMIEIGDYVYAARGFTCGHVDAVKVFSKKGKPMKTTKDAVNTLIKAGGVMELI